MYFYTNRALKEREQSRWQKGTSLPMRQIMLLTGRILIKAWREITSACAQKWSRDKAELEDSQTAWNSPLCPKWCKTYSFFKFIWEPKWYIRNAKSSAEQNSKYILASFKQSLRSISSCNRLHVPVKMKRHVVSWWQNAPWAKFYVTERPIIAVRAAHMEKSTGFWLLKRN